MEKEWKEWINKSVTASEILNLGPCFVKHICLTADTGGAATTLIYNNQNSSGSPKLALSAVASTHFNDDFAIPVFFDKALYVSIGSNVTLFMIQYKPAPGK